MRNDLRFWGGVMLGIGIAASYWPIQLFGFGMATIFAFALLRARS